jgi:hypothetical protein
MAVTTSWRWQVTASVGVIVVYFGWSLLLHAAELPQQLVVRNKSGQTIEVLTASLGGGYIRRSARGEWLGRVILVGNTYHFVDPEGRTVATAQPEPNLPGPSGNHSLATVRDTRGDIAGAIFSQ